MIPPITEVHPNAVCKADGSCVCPVCTCQANGANVPRP